MTPGYAIIKGIVACYWMGEFSDNDWTHVERCLRKTIEKLIRPKLKDLEGLEAETLDGYIQTLEWMLSSYKDHKFDKDDLVSRIKVAHVERQSLTDEFLVLIGLEVDEAVVFQKLKAMVSEFEHSLRLTHYQELVRKLNREVNFSDGGRSITDIVSEFTSETEKLRTNGEGPAKGLVSSLDSSNPSSLEELFKRSVEMSSAVGVIRTPFKGLNRACGYGGFRRGEFINFAGLSHHYKTGILLDVFRGALQYNTPYMWDKTKKPLIIHLSFENRIEQNLPTLYKSIYEQRYQKACDRKNINPVDAAAFLKEAFSKSGYEYQMLCFESGTMRPEDIVTMLASLEAQGYEIHMVVCDYMELIVKNAERKDEAILSALDSVRSYTMTHGITFINGHQLSPDAQRIYREGAVGFTERINNGGFYRNTTQLHTKLDLEFVQAKVTHPSGNYMSWSRGKHRGGEDTPEKHLHFSKKFHEFGGLKDDVELEEDDTIYSLGAYLGNLDGNSFEAEAESEGGQDLMDIDF